MVAHHTSSAPTDATTIQQDLVSGWPAAVCKAAASLGFLVNISSFLVIKEVGSVALKVLGTARNAGLVLFSALVMGEATTPLEIGGYAIALLGFAAVKYAENAGL